LNHVHAKEKRYNGRHYLYEPEFIYKVSLFRGHLIAVFILSLHVGAFLVLQAVSVGQSGVDVRGPESTFSAILALTAANEAVMFARP
jgi:hypothetical protein